MSCLIRKYYLNTFLPRSSINRLLNFTDIYICFWFPVKTVLLILCLTKFNTKFVFFFFLFYFLISVRYLSKKKLMTFLKKVAYHRTYSRKSDFPNECWKLFQLLKSKCFSNNFKPNKKACKKYMKILYWFLYAI